MAPGLSWLSVLKISDSKIAKTNKKRPGRPPNQACEETPMQDCSNHKDHAINLWVEAFCIRERVKGFVD